MTAPWYRELASRYTKYRSPFGAVSGPLVALSLALVRRLPPGWVVPVRVPRLRRPVWLRTHSTDIEVFEQIFMKMELRLPLAAAPRTIVDAGANIGIASLWFARAYPDARIVALELEPGNCEMLARNTRGYPNIRVVNAGLWSHRARLRVVDSGYGAYAFHAAQAEADEPGTVPALGVADLADEVGGRIDLLKIDIEGSEVAVFARGTEAWIDRVDAIAVEPHDRIFAEATDTIRAATAERFDESQVGEYLVYTRRRAGAAAPRAAGAALTGAGPQGSA
jgi:FkbM family methyltransferase